MKGEKETTSKKLTGSIFIIAVLSLCLCITTFALIYSMVSVDNNLFQTGVVKINLNDEKPVIDEHEFLFEPGMTVKKDFFLENESSCDVYYKIYFENVEGGLADIIEVSVRDGEKVLYKGHMTELTREQTLAAEDILKLRETRNLQIYFHFPESVGNEAQKMNLNFDIAADAVQTKNNTERIFEE